MKKISFLLMTAGLLLFAACNNSSTKGSGNNSTTENPDKENTPPEVSEPQLQEVKLVCKPGPPDGVENPRNVILLSIDGKETLIDTIYACSTIAPEDYTNHEIPAHAIHAAGGWFAGAGDYFYVIRENDEVAVYYGWQDEMQEDEGFHWEKVKL